MEVDYTVTSKFREQLQLSIILAVIKPVWLIDEICWYSSS